MRLKVRPSSESVMPFDSDTSHRPTAGQAASGMKGHGVFTYRGDDTGSGDWKCLTHLSNSKCVHITCAQGHLGKLAAQECEGMPQDDLVAPGATTESPDLGLPPTDQMVPPAGPSVLHELSVSYQPVPLPLWARLPEDAAEEVFLGARERPPATLCLGTSARCAWHPELSVMPRKEDKCCDTCNYTI
ncbi:hypothetical protein JB92DRAFT_3113930 [Gautieria morchelliformis]|nr:hypothetical protein JB92DRAFT_3113930 [Gautieria morchelliformis]